MFRFKQFALQDDNSALKVTTDAAVLGAWTDVRDAKVVLDAGCGCGILGLMIAQRAPHACITAVDNHPGSITDATSNAENSPFADRIRVINADITSLQGAFDLIVSNPPFFTETLQSPDAARAAARHAGKFSHLALPSLAAGMLAPNGHLVFIAPSDADSAIEEALTIAGLHPQRKLCFRQSERRPWVRTLWDAARHPEKFVTLEELTISDHNGYTSAYRTLLSPYMLHF
ncbi:MAG: methyltransferase [Bacteroides sp.]|nr:methyltransferase [Bacteroides sp.]